MSSEKFPNQKGNPMAIRRILVLDFDYTVVSENTDTVVRDLLPKDLTKDLSKIAESKGWIAHMTEVFRLLHEQKIGETKILDAIRRIPEVRGMIRCLKRLRQTNFTDYIIISDSNSIFISEWIKAHKLEDFFDAIFTNPAEFDENGMLTIKPYHHQTDCKISAKNLCKGKILEHYLVTHDLRHNFRYEPVVYVGDGNNDLCPVLRLRPCDIACARRGFALQKRLENPRGLWKKNCDLILWKDGYDLLDQLEIKFRLQELQREGMMTEKF